MPNDGSRYLMEIVVERGPYLSIPNVSIIEEGSEHVVYVQKGTGRYVPQAIHTGLQGELYTQVIDGLEQGDQVVSVGSFFVDAENKLKSSNMAAMPSMDHGAMAGMEHSAITQVAAAPPGSDLQLVMSEPEPNATVKAPLYMIHLMFNLPVDVKSTVFDLTDKNGKPVDVGDVMPMDDDGKVLMATPKAPLPAGTYKVKWRTKGSKANPIQGEFSFIAD
jgi:methionine-rich copper-binding protein CopC